MSKKRAKKKVFVSVHEKSRWLSELLFTDFDAVTGLEAWRFFAEYHVFLFGEGFSETPIGKTHSKSAKSLEAKIASRDPREAMKHIQEIILNFLILLVRLRDGKIKNLPPIESRKRVRMWEEDGSLWLENADAASEAGMLQEKIVLFFSEVGPDAIKQCQNKPCQKPFIHTSKRERIYCCQRCAWQQTSRDKREEEKKKEKKKGGK